MVTSVVLAAALVAAPVFEDRPVDETSAKKVITGAAVGTAAMGSCTTYFVLRDRMKDQKPTLSTATCYGITMLLSSAAYGYKEGIRDPDTVDQPAPRGRRDFAEGVGGTAVGALIFVPVATW